MRFLKLLLPMLALLMAAPALAVDTGGSHVYANWSPQGRTAITAGTTTSNVALPTTGPTAWVCNQSTSIDAFVNFGSSNAVTATTTAGYKVKAGKCQAYSLIPVNSQWTYIAAITASSTAALYIETGYGQPLVTDQAAASGGGGSTAVTIADGADVTQGAVADAAWSGTGSGTVVSVLKYIGAKIEAVRALLAGTVAVSGPLTDTQLRASPVPISGTVTATGPLTDTQLRASAVPVSGTVTATSTPGTGSPTVGGALIGTSSAQLLASGTRIYVSVQNVSVAATVACRWGGTAILNDINSFMIGPMGSKTYEGSYVPSGVALNCISDTASSPVYAEVK